MKIKTGVLDDFRRMVRDKEATAIYFSRQLFRDSIAGPPTAEKPNEPTAQQVLTGMLIVVAETEKDTITYVQVLPQFKTDFSEKSISSIRENIDAEELKIINLLKETETPPMMYSAEVEDEYKGLIQVLGRKA